MAPKELEISPLENYLGTYFGLCVSERFHSYQKTLSNLKFHKKSNLFTIYCSFGTYYGNESLNIIFNFLEKLIIICLDKKCRLICSIKRDFLNLLEIPTILKKNIQIHSDLNQLECLAIADLFLSHGGLGSIKESILFKTPIIVYPLNKKNDQVLNSLIVDSENVGLSRNINRFESLCDDIENIKNNS